MAGDYSIYQQDLQKPNCSLQLERFRNTSVASGISQAINIQNVDFYNCVVNGLSQRCLDNAFGIQLDVLGVIVGQSRILQNFGLKNWFTPDDVGNGPDGGISYVFDAPLGGNLPADDFQYRQLINAKIFRNHVKYGSIPEIMQFAKIAYSIDISIRKEGLSDLALIVPESTPDYIIQNLTSFEDTLQADKTYFLPIPTTGRLTKLIRKTTPAFAPDRPNSGPDVGKLAIEIPLE